MALGLCCRSELLVRRLGGDFPLSPNFRGAVPALSEVLATTSPRAAQQILCGDRAANRAFSAEGRSRSNRRSCEEYLSMGKQHSEMDRRQFGRPGEREISRQNRNAGR